MSSWKPAIYALKAIMGIKGMFSPQGISMLCAQYLGLYLGHSFFISQTMQKKKVFLAGTVIAHPGVTAQWNSEILHPQNTLWTA